MTDDNPQNSADAPLLFPYSVLWSGYGNAEVSLKELRLNADEYHIFNEMDVLAKQGISRVTKEAVRAVMKANGVAGDCLDFWLVCCFYLAPKQAEAFGLDPERSREILMQAANTARRLDRSLSRLGPKIFAGLYFKRPHVAGVERPKGSDFYDLHTELRDFDLVAREAATELKNAEGRPRNHHRTTMIRLFIELMFEREANDLAVSNGTKAKPEAHLTGNAGRFLFELIRLVEPNWSEQWVAPKVKPILRDFRKKRAAGEKTRQT